MKHTFSMKMPYLFVILTGVLLLQSCASISVKPGDGTAIIREADRQIVFGATHHQQNHFVYDDTSFVSTTDTRDSTTVLRCNYWTDETQWKTTFARRSKESNNFIWYSNSSINVISHYYTRANDYGEDDTLCFDVRRFDNNTGELLGQRELLRIADDDYEKRYGFKLSADSSHLLMFLYDKYEVAMYNQNVDDEPELWKAELFLLRPDMAEIQRASVGIVVSEDYADDYNPALAVGNNGMVFYSFSRIVSDTIAQQSVVRLDIAQNRTDTLTTSFSRMMVYSPWSTVTLEPHEPLLQSLSGDTVLLAWPYFFRGELRLLAVSKLDFRNKTFVFADTIFLDDETCEYLIDDDMDDFRLADCIALPSGETLVVLEQILHYSDNYTPMFQTIPMPPITIPTFRILTVPTASTAPITSLLPITSITSIVGAASSILTAPGGRLMKNGPIVLIKLDNTGAVQWKSSLIREVTGIVSGHYSSYHITDTSFCLLYRDDEVDDGITFSEFMLSDGRSRWQELSVTFSGRSSWYSNHTLWLRDAVVLYGEADAGYRCLRVNPSGKYTWFDKEHARRIVEGKKVE